MERRYHGLLRRGTKLRSSSCSRTVLSLNRRIREVRRRYRGLLRRGTWLWFSCYLRRVQSSSHINHHLRNPSPHSRPHYLLLRPRKNPHLCVSHCHRLRRPQCRHQVRLEHLLPPMQDQSLAVSFSVFNDGTQNSRLALQERHRSHEKIQPVRHTHRTPSRPKP